MLEVKNKIEFEGNCWVGEVDASLFNSSEECRIKAVTDIASITKGRLGMYIGKYDETSYCSITQEKQGFKAEEKIYSPVRQRLYDRLLVESAGKPSTPFEFVPIIEETIFTPCEKELNQLYKHGVSDPSNDRLFTNMRNILCSGEFLYDQEESTEDFKVIVGRVPMKVVSHLRTHRAFSWLVESSRNKRYLKEVEFWYPSWWNKVGKNTLERPYVEYMKDLDMDIVDTLKEDVEEGLLKPEEATMELSDRRLVTFAMCAWKQNTDAWDNLFAVRGDKTGTMSITGETVKHIKTLINE